MSRKSGNRFSDEDMRHSIKTRACSDSTAMGRALAALNERAVLVRLGDIPRQILPEENGPHRGRLTEDIKFAVADQPVLRVGLLEVTPGQRHGAEVAKLRRVTDGIGLEQLAVLRSDEAVAVLIPFNFDLWQSTLRPANGEIGNGIIAFDRKRALF